MKNLLKLTDYKTTNSIIIGASNIIDAKRIFLKSHDVYVTEIRSIGAMVSTNWVTETIEEVTNQYMENNQQS